MNIEFIKRMLVDSDNLSDIRKRFLSGETISETEIGEVIKKTPTHPHIAWGPDSFTLISWEGIQHLHDVILKTKDIEGDFIETGVWRGGMCILAKSMFNELKLDKKVYVADSFCGLPMPSKEYPQDNGDAHYLSEYLKVSQEQVEKNFKLFNCLDDKVIFLKGWFKDTLPKASIKKLSILRLDGDMYQSTMDGLDNLYHKLSIGGYCIVDDYLHIPCKNAVLHFREKNKITEEMFKMSRNNNLDEIHYWVKQKEINLNTL